VVTTGAIPYRPAAVPDSDAMLDAIAPLVPAIAAAANRTETERHVPADIVRALADGGVFRMLVPRALGGGEVSPATMVRALETIARADGSAGWVAMIGATSGVASAYLPPESAGEIYGPRDAITGGAYAPHGRAVVTADGYRVSGRWPFASGCEHCTWLMGGAVVLDGGTPRLLPDGSVDARLMLFPADVVRVLDTWNVAGLRGTGSHDIVVDGVTVPGARSFSLVADRPFHDRPLYAFPVFGLLALGIAAVALGIARAAVDELVRLATMKTPTGSRRTLAERPLAQAAVAQAEAGLEAARAFVFAAIDEAWERARTDGALDVRLRARLRLAATHAARAAASAVDLAWDAGGGTVVYETSPLQRHFRDVHVATQHVMVAPPTLELAGRVLLGVGADTAML
jgi:alkylation response protein AidB-like acyl-CoA dehydrogenase